MAKSVKPPKTPPIPPKPPSAGGSYILKNDVWVETTKENKDATSDK